MNVESNIWTLPALNDISEPGLPPISESIFKTSAEDD